MKQYGKDRTPAFPMYWCNQKAPCCDSSACGYECRMTCHKRYARKDAKGKPMIAFRVRLAADRITVIELADRMKRVTETMGAAFEIVHNALMRVTEAMRCSHSSLFSDDYFIQ